MTDDDANRIRVGHSPDPDDAFMFYGIAAEQVDTEGFRIEQVLADIESLNRRALEGELKLDGEHPRLVHQPPAMVGTPNPRLVLSAMF